VVEPDELLRGRIRLFQPARGPRVSLDALLLADFARAAARGGRLVDLGCGTGVVAIALLVGDPRARGVGVELQPELAELARRNAELNGLADRLEIVEADLTRPLPLPAAGFDLVVANPPFHRGRPAPAPARAVARHEIAATLTDVLAAARKLLRPKGRAAVVYPAHAIAELAAVLLALGLRPAALRFVHSVADEPARRVLALGSAGGKGGAAVLPPLVVHGPDRRSYTDEAARILGEARD
jgi:tRNA1Val (adenine37-N6)-methyltransferase